MRWRPSWDGDLLGPYTKLYLFTIHHELDFIDISSKLCAIKIKTTRAHTWTLHT